ncbi:hypothetical protein ACQEVS_10235 [Streptomyces sp. CA-181903]|uniref:hypothetical protein n=1 Tax=Streptomyces sp. CA-181903 TaxID=3240055 RepID=UPI003D8F697D
MPVTLRKTPRSFTVLMQDGAIHAVLLTPSTEEDRDVLYLDAWADCLDVHRVTAIDGFDAHTQATNAHQRTTAIESYMLRSGTTYEAAHDLYRRLRTWADSIGAENRAHWANRPIVVRFPLMRFVLTEAMREHRDPTA